MSAVPESLSEENPEHLLVLETMLHFLQFMREHKILAEDFSPKSLL